MKNMVIKYAFLLFGFLFLGIFIHYGLIAPFIEVFFQDDMCNGLTQMFLLLIIEPAMSIIFVVYLINKQEKQYYDTLL